MKLSTDKKSKTKVPESRRAKAVRLGVTVVLLAILAVSLFFIIKYYYDSYINSKKNEELRNLRSSVTTSASSSEDPNSFSALIDRNADIMGWLTVPGTNIDYPVVQTKGTENAENKYLHTDFDGKESRDGTLFFDRHNSFDTLSKNTIIFGHNMKDGQMFAQLENYERKSGNDYLGFYNKNPLIRLDTLENHLVYKIFAVFVTSADYNSSGAFYYLDTDFESDSKFDEFIDGVNKRNFLKTNVDVKSTDKILTLSTCDYAYPKSPDGDHARLVVMARLLRGGESETVEPAKINTQILYPDFYHKIWNGK